MPGGYKSGNLLLKIVIRESHLDTNATTSVLRLKLSALDTYIPKVNSVIVKFNTYVRLLLDSLAARGEESSDTLVNLFKGYQAASDKPFTDYVNRLQESHDDGNTMTPDVLMQRAVDKFKNLKQAGNGMHQRKKRKRFWHSKQNSRAFRRKRGTIKKKTRKKEERTR